MLAILIIIWGSSWSINKMALAYTPPLLYAGLRATCGGVLLSLFLLHTWKKIQWRKHWKKYCISGILNIAIFFGVQTIGLIYLPGGLFSVLVYLQPVLIGIFAWLWLDEKMSFSKLSGLLVGFIGIFVISAEGMSGNISMLGVLLGLLTAASWALGVIYIKKTGGVVDAMWMVVLQSVIGGVLLLLFGTGMESWSAINPTWPYLLAFLFGSTLGIPVAYVIYYHLVYSGEASKVASFTFLVPVFSVFVSSIFLKEPLTSSLLAGLIFIVLSISIVNYNGKWKKTAMLEEEKDFVKHGSQ